MKELKSLDLMPYIVYLGPPSLAKFKELKHNLNEHYKDNELLDIINKGKEIEDSYGHYFDKVIRVADSDKTYKELFDLINRVQNDETWTPVQWLS